MPDPKKLQGLKGLNEISQEERDQFYLDNEDRLRAYSSSPSLYQAAARKLYENQKFINTFGQDAFDQTTGHGKQGAAFRKKLLKEKAVNDAWQSLSPFDENGVRDNNRGLGENWEEYSRGLSTEGKLELLQSDWKSKEEQKEADKGWLETAADYGAKGLKWLGKAMVNLPATAAQAIANAVDAPDEVKTFLDYANLGGNIAGEMMSSIPSGVANAAAYYDRSKNDEILERIYTNDSKKQVAAHSGDVSRAYYDPAIVGENDDDTVQKFIREITPGSYVNEYGLPNRGIPEYASHYGKGGDDISWEMDDFSIDDMRKVLAKKYVYDHAVSPEVSARALNDEAQQYIYDHSNIFKDAALFGKDLGISILSYTADKFAGAYAGILPIVDAVEGNPTVYVDDTGQVIDRSKTQLLSDRNHNVFYEGEDGRRHTVHPMQVGRTALFEMGKDADGEDIPDVFNPVFWNKAEMYGDLTHEGQEQWEKLGSSPYKVAWEPGEDGNLLYESAKMASFPLADAALTIALATMSGGISMGGKALEGLSQAGKVMQGIGKGISTVGKVLSPGSKPMQVAQGTLGAIGIAHAYGRNAFQEMLTKNLSEAEESLATTSRNEIYQQYSSDADYKAQVDTLIQARAQELKADYLRQAYESGEQPMEESQVNELARATAQEMVLGELSQQRLDEKKNSPEYAKLQEAAINQAGKGYANIFWPEALKYGLVNTIGFRKWMYTNPTKIGRATKNFEGLGEYTTEAGAKRLKVTAPKYPTAADKAEAVWGPKLKLFGKTAVSQVWGGAWTNGTDDMMVDAAEQINSDRFQAHIHDFETGESTADLYGLASWTHSYLTGLGESLGQETTWRAAAIGGIGSAFNLAPNFVNLAHLMTKQGREEYKRNFLEAPRRDENGYVLKGEDGKPIVDNLSWKDNWRDRVAFFTQNGILSEYYGLKQHDRDLQYYADYVNGILDRENDFGNLESLLVSNRKAGASVDEESGRLAAFTAALNTQRYLEALGQDEHDPTLLSSVVNRNKALVEKAATMKTDGSEGSLTDKEIQEFLSSYYAVNTNIPQNEENNAIALQTIQQNAQDIQKASQAYTEASEKIDAIDKARRKQGKGTMSPLVKIKLVNNQATAGYLKERLAANKEAIGDNSTSTELTVEDIIPAIGGRREAEALAKAYDRQIREFEQTLKEVQAERAEKEKVYQQAKQERDAAKDSGKRFLANEKLVKAAAEFANAQQQELFTQEQLDISRNKQSRVKEALEIFKQQPGVEADVVAAEAADKAEEEALKALAQAKKHFEWRASVYVNAKDPKKRSSAKGWLTRASRRLDQARQAFEEAQKVSQEAEDKVNGRILTADEIMSLDPVSRARMMQNPKQYLPLSEPYSRAQQKEIEILRDRLKEKDPMADARIQNIAALQQQVSAYEDAYRRISENPEAAEEQLKNIAIERNKIAANLFYQRAADALVYSTKLLERETEAYGSKQEETDAQVQEKIRALVYSGFKQLNPKILDILEEEGSLTKYQQQLNEAREWANTLGDILDVINNMSLTDEQKASFKDRLDIIEARSDKRQDFLDNIEKAIDIAATPEDAKLYEELLQKLENVGYTRNATILENREQRKQREAEQQAERDKAAQEALAMEEAVAKELEEIKPQVKDIEAKAAEATPLGESDVIPLEGIEASDAPPINESPIPEPPVVVEPAAKKPIKINSLLTDEVQDAEVAAGNMSSNGDSAEEGLFVVEKNSKDGKSTITFGLDLGDGGMMPDDITLSPSDWTEVVKGPSIEELGEEGKNTPFVATSVEKNGEDWIFNGNFAGREQSNQLKASKSFNLEEAIEKERKARRAEALTQGKEVNTPYIGKEADGTLVTQTPTLQEELAASPVPSNEAQVLPNNNEQSEEDASNATEGNPNSGILTLSGNALKPYDDTHGELSKQHRIVRRKGAGKEQLDSLGQFYKWLEVKGLNMQNIIDYELHEILARDPQTKVHFMTLNPEVVKTLGVPYAANHLLLAIEYDSTVERVHKKENGEPITAGGKKYLPIGVLGFGQNIAANKEKRDAYNVLFNRNSRQKSLILSRRKDYFDAHPEETAWVPEDLSTEIVPMYPTAGYLITQLEGEEKQFRTLKELFGDSKRNPYGLRLTTSDLVWGIQKFADFMVIGNTRGKQVMVPKKSAERSGTAFLLIPASNGKLQTVAIRPMKFADAEFRDGKLKQEVNQAFDDLTSIDPNRRATGLDTLSRIFHFDPKWGNAIKLNNEKREITLYREGKPFATFVVGDGFSMTDFLEKINEMNPRINITPSVLGNQRELEKYDEAGALMVDIATLSTMGAGFEVYPIDTSGNMVKPSDSSTASVSRERNNSVENTRRQIIHKGSYYDYDSISKEYKIEGNRVTDPALLKQLEFSRRIAEHEIQSVESHGDWDYFILEEGEHPVAVKKNKITQEVVQSTEEQANKLIEKERARREERQRQAEANKVLDEMRQEEEEAERLEDFDFVPNGEGDITFENIEAGASAEKPAPRVEERPVEKSKEEKKEESQPNPKEETLPPAVPKQIDGSTSNTITFQKLAIKKEHRGRLDTLLKQKRAEGWDVPTKMSDMVEFLRSKGVEVDAIGTDELSIEAWYKTIEDCR